MKNIFLIGLVLLLMSCSSQQDKIVKDCEKYLKSEMNDPQSYERVSYEFVDTIYFSESIRHQILIKDVDLVELPPPPPGVINIQPIPNNPKEIDSLKYILNDIKNHPKKDYIVGYKLGIKFRHNNIMGAKILNGQIFIYKLNPNKGEPKIKTLLNRSY